VACSTGAWPGERTTFDPSLSLTAAYTDNVGFVETPGVSDPADTSLVLGVVLPLTRKLRNGRWELTYQTEFIKFDEFTDLDNNAHRFRFGVETDLSKFSTLDFAVYYVLTQDQILIDQIETGDQHRYG